MPKRVRIFAGPNGSGKSTIKSIVEDKVNLGTYVNADEIEKRYYRTMSYLLSALKLVDDAYLFDNSKSEANMFAVKKNDTLEIQGEYIPKWFITYVIEKLK